MRIIKEKKSGQRKWETKLEKGNESEKEREGEKREKLWNKKEKNRVERVT